MAVALTAIMDYENKSNTPGQEEDKLPDQEGWKEPDQLTCLHRRSIYGTPLAVQWLRLHASNAGDSGSILSWELRSHMPPDMGKR